MSDEDVGSLTVSRLPGESIQIGDAKVTIVKTRGSRVHVRIEAPKSLSVRRIENIKSSES